MMIAISEKLKKKLRRLEKNEKEHFLQAVWKLILGYDGKSLSGRLSGLRSLRIGKYRLIYRREKDKIILLAFGKRKVIYEDL